MDKSCKIFFDGRTVFDATLAEHIKNWLSRWTSDPTFMSVRQICKSIEAELGIDETRARRLLKQLDLI